MGMREKLIDIVEAYADFLDWDTKEEMVDSIMGALATDNNVGDKWISVKDRLPENEQNVLVADNGFIAVWTFYGDYWEDSHGWWQEFDEVTHWMPLPQPPKGE